MQLSVLLHAPPLHSSCHSMPLCAPLCPAFCPSTHISAFFCAPLCAVCSPLNLSMCCSVPPYYLYAYLCAICAPLPSSECHGISVLHLHQRTSVSLAAFWLIDSIAYFLPFQFHACSAQPRSIFISGFHGIPALQPFSAPACPSVQFPYPLCIPLCTHPSSILIGCLYGIFHGIPVPYPLHMPSAHPRSILINWPHGILVPQTSFVSPSTSPMCPSIPFNPLHGISVLQCRSSSSPKWHFLIHSHIPTANM